MHGCALAEAGKLDAAVDGHGRRASAPLALKNTRCACRSRARSPEWSRAAPPSDGLPRETSSVRRRPGKELVSHPHASPGRISSGSAAWATAKMPACAVSRHAAAQSWPFRPIGRFEMSTMMKSGDVPSRI